MCTFERMCVCLQLCFVYEHKFMCVQGFLVRWAVGMQVCRYCFLYRFFYNHDLWRCDGISSQGNQFSSKSSTSPINLLLLLRLCFLCHVEARCNLMIDGLIDWSFGWVLVCDLYRCRMRHLLVFNDSIPQSWSEVVLAGETQKKNAVGRIGKRAVPAVMNRASLQLGKGSCQ